MKKSNNWPNVNKDGEVKSLSHVRLFVTPWTVAYRDPQSMGFSRQEYWSGLPFPSPKIWGRTVQLRDLNHLFTALLIQDTHTPLWVCISALLLMLSSSLERVPMPLLSSCVFLLLS